MPSEDGSGGRRFRVRVGSPWAAVAAGTVGEYPRLRRGRRQERMFLRRLRLSTALAFVFSFITVYNLRMLDMFRYGASLENYVGFVMLSDTPEKVEYLL